MNDKKISLWLAILFLVLSGSLYLGYFFLDFPIDVLIPGSFYMNLTILLTVLGTRNNNG